MNKILSAVVLAFALSGCAAVSAPAQPLPAATIVGLQNDALAAKIAFQAGALITVAYIERPRCGRPTSPPLCSDQAAVDVMRMALTAGDNATKAAEAAAKALTPDTTALQALVLAAQQSVVALNAITPKN